MYIQFALMVMQMLLGYKGYNLFGIQGYGLWHGFVRITLWFYEPSYLATYLVFWVMLSLSMWIIYGDLSYKKDAILSILAEVITTSTTGYLGVAVCFAILYILLLFNKRLSLKTLLILLILIIIFYSFTHTALYDAVVGRIGRQGLAGASGNRIIGWFEGLEVFKMNILFGVGPGCYGRYLNDFDYHVATNITIDLLATLGIFSTVSFYYLHVYFAIIYFAIKSKDIKNKICIQKSNITVSVLLSVTAFLIVLQANQNYLRAYHWMFLGLLQGVLLTMLRRMCTDA